MDLLAIFDTWTTGTLIFAAIFIGLCCHGMEVYKITRRALLRAAPQIFRSTRVRSESEIRADMRRLHRELLKAGGLPPLQDFTELPGCPQMTLLLESASIDMDGRLPFSYAPWLDDDPNAS